MNRRYVAQTLFADVWSLAPWSWVTLQVHWACQHTATSTTTGAATMARTIPHHQRALPVRLQSLGQGWSGSRWGAVVAWSILKHWNMAPFQRFYHLEDFTSSAAAARACCKGCFVGMNIVSGWLVPWAGRLVHRMLFAHQVFRRNIFIIPIVLSWSTSWMNLSVSMVRGWFVKLTPQKIQEMRWQQRCKLGRGRWASSMLHQGTPWSLVIVNQGIWIW